MAIDEHRVRCDDAIRKLGQIDVHPRLPQGSTKALRIALHCFALLRGIAFLCIAWNCIALQCFACLHVRDYLLIEVAPGLFFLWLCFACLHVRDVLLIDVVLQALTCFCAFFKSKKRVSFKRWRAFCTPQIITSIKKACQRQALTRFFQQNKIYNPKSASTSSVDALFQTPKL